MRSATRRMNLLRTATAFAVMVAVMAGATAAGAAGSDYLYWYAVAQTKIYPTTVTPGWMASGPDGAPAMLLSAARGEAEGRQIAIRPSSQTLTDIWIEPSDLVADTGAALPASTIETFKVHYVNVTYPSYGYTRKGLEPDALIPLTLANGERLGWKPDGTSTTGLRAAGANVTAPYYVLFSVPATATPGTYNGTLKITGTALDGTPAPEVTIPVSLKVRQFSVATRGLKTSFGANLQWAMYTGSADHKWLPPNTDPPATRIAERTTFKADQLGGWLEYFSEHRVSPQFMLPAWENGSDWAPPADNNRMVARRAYLDDYLGTRPATTRPGNRFGFNTVKMPEYGAPSWVADPFASASNTSKAAAYYSSMSSQLGSAYRPRAYAYPIDEPPASKRAFVERYAAFVHRYAPGVKFMVTTDAVTQNYRLLKSVDIYGQKLHFYFRDWTRWIKPIRTAKKGVWIYSHATTWQKQAPAYLVDQPLTASRSQGWYAYRTRADGLLYFSVNAWRPKTGSAAYRDPYVDPLSFRSTINGKPVYANGDGSLVYPGYYPRLGLHVQGAPPVGSLRMEAIRDGLEDHEYVRQLGVRYGVTVADKYVARIIGPVPTQAAGRIAFPPYKTAPVDYERVRNDIAAALER